MPRTTFAGAKAELVALFGTVNAPSVTGVDRLFDHLPTMGDLSGGVSLCVFLSGVDAESMVFGVRVYVDATGRGMKKAQDDLDAVMQAVDDVLSAPFGSRSWQISFPTEDAPFFAADLSVSVGREDYF